MLPGIRQENNQKIPVLLEELSEYKESHTENRSNSREKVIDKKIKTYVHETSLLKMQGFDNNLETLLLKQLEENMKVDCTDYSFYTDGSLVKEEDECRMGASWVQVSKDESRLLMEGKMRIAKWPSSTKAELAAVWMVVLVVACNSKIVVKLDSAAAIASLESEEPLHNIRV